MNVDDFNRIIFFQVLTQLCDIYIHTTCIEIVVINPNSLQRKVTLQNFVGMCTKQAQQFGFFGGQFSLLLGSRQNLFLRVECKLTNLIDVALLVLLSANTSQDSFNSESQLLDRKSTRLNSSHV